MSTTASTTKGLIALPTGKEALATAGDLGLIAGGMIAAHALVTMTKKDTLLVNGGVAVVGLGVAMTVKHPIAKMVGLGIAAYGTIKTIGLAAKEVAAPDTTAGLNGILPEKVKSMIRKFIPTLSGMDEFNGMADFNGTDDELNNLSLDDIAIRSEGSYSGSEDAIEGLSGEVLSLVA